MLVNSPLGRRVQIDRIGRRGYRKHFIAPLDQSATVSPLVGNPSINQLRAELAVASTNGIVLHKGTCALALALFRSSPGCGICEQAETYPRSVREFNTRLTRRCLCRNQGRGIESLSRTAAKEHARDRVRISAVSVAINDTAMSRKAGAFDAERDERMRAIISVGRSCIRPKSCERSSDLCVAESSFCYGRDLVAPGGATA